MKIAVNTRFLIPDKLDGIGWFSHEVISRITRDHPEHTFYFLFDRPYSQSFIYADNVYPVILRPPARHPVLWHIWFQYRVAHYLKKNPVDLFFSPDGFIPLKTNIPSIAVIHDLNFMHYPKELPGGVSLYYRRFFPEFARKATRIITVSNFSRQDILRHLPVTPDIIHVAYNGVNAVFTPLGEKEKQKTRERFTGGKKYFVHIGTLLPRKNLPRLLKAFDSFRDQSPQDFKLILAGRPMFGIRAIQKVMRQMKHASDVILTGGLTQKDTHLILGSSEALLFVSYFEGFGIPLTEAMACQVPVVASTATSIPEVCGEAALYTDPFSETSITRAMIRISLDKDLRHQLIKKGTERVGTFTWESTADKIWKAMEEVIDNNSALS